MKGWDRTAERRRQGMQHQLELNILLDLEFMPGAQALTLDYLAVDDQLEPAELKAVQDGANFWLEMNGAPRRIFSLTRGFEGYYVLTITPN